MKIWNTKYALTTGITEHEAEVGENENRALVRKTESSHFDMYLSGKDWHKTKEAAIARANEMKIKKLQSLDKQIKKISAIEFDL